MIRKSGGTEGVIRSRKSKKDGQKEWLKEKEQ